MQQAKTNLCCPLVSLSQARDSIHNTCAGAKRYALTTLLNDCALPGWMLRIRANQAWLNRFIARTALKSRY